MSYFMKNNMKIKLKSFKLKIIELFLIFKIIFLNV